MPRAVSLVARRCGNSRFSGPEPARLLRLGPQLQAAEEDCRQHRRSTGNDGAHEGAHLEAGGEGTLRRLEQFVADTTRQLLSDGDRPAECRGRRLSRIVGDTVGNLIVQAIPIDRGAERGEERDRERAAELRTCLGDSGRGTRALGRRRTDDEVVRQT